MNPCRPRSPAGDAGLPRAIQMVSETRTESVARASAAEEIPFSKLGEPISSSNSQSTRRLIGRPASRAALIPKRAVSAGPLSSVVPRPRYRSPAFTNSNGSVSHGSVSFEAGWTSRWL